MIFDFVKAKNKQEEVVIDDRIRNVPEIDLIVVHLRFFYPRYNQEGKSSVEHPVKKRTPGTKEKPHWKSCDPVPLWLSLALRQYFQKN